jgi:Zn-dependent peptidase ImmA (M78 family)
VHDASEFLASFWLGNLPVDPFRLARLNGVRVVDAKFPNGSISGALLKEFGKRPRALLNIRDAPTHRRFTLAHELGHFVWNGDAEGEYERVDYRDHLSSTGRYIEEIYANTFAACVLMPEPHVRAMHEEGTFDWEMAERFGVSVEAIRFRLSDLGLSL